MTTRTSGSADKPAAACHERLHVAVLLSAAGGFLDAFTWLAHGRVFANAQTGNVVLLGLFAAMGQWSDALRHVPPIIAFVLGVYVAHRLRLHSAQSGRQRVALFSLALEMALLTIVATLPPGHLDLPIVLGVAFVAALQSSCFSRVEGWAYSSVMTTGNLRRTAEALFEGTSPPRDDTALREARVFATICCAFALGTGVGAFMTARVDNAALIIPIGLLGAALFSCLRAQTVKQRSPNH